MVNYYSKALEILGDDLKKADVKLSSVEIKGKVLNEADDNRIIKITGGHDVIALYEKLTQKNTSATKDQDHIPVILEFYPDNTAKSPSIGVIGGQGPAASAFFLRKLEQENVPFICFSNPKIEDRTTSIMNEDIGMKNRIGKMINESMNVIDSQHKNLMYCFPCNTMHHWAEQVDQKYHLVNMVKRTAEELSTKLRPEESALVLCTSGTIKAKVFENALKQKGVSFVFPNKEEQVYIMNAITDVKAGRDPSVENVIEILKKYGQAKCVILGCTELPLLFNHPKIAQFTEKNNIFKIDPMEVLTKKVKLVHETVIGFNKKDVDRTLERKEISF